MILKELFTVVSDEQEVVLYGDFDTVKAYKTTMEAVLSEKVLGMTVDCVEAGSDCDLKVWVKG